ncbi:MAG: tyrosine-type recombinase/integrase [Candidatus Caenarcaniphilales bacterium]|nr:tyrosine-type recombinase/integrase [Candidatus Caenarcaniphilales bacterium]
MNQLEQLCRSFVEGTNSAINTKKAYLSDLKTLWEKYSSLEILNDKGNWRDLRLYLIDRYSKKSAARKWSSWREFMRFCQHQALVQENPIFELDFDHPNQIRSIRGDLTLQDILVVIDSTENTRDRALLWFMLSTGLRSSELSRYGLFRYLNLAAREFNLPDRVTFLCEPAYQALQAYLGERPQLSGHTAPGLNEAIFLSDRGQPLAEAYIYSLCRTLSEPLDKHLSVGDLRDLLTRELLSEGLTPEETCYLMGFKTLKSLEPFLHNIV